MSWTTEAIGMLGVRSDCEIGAAIGRHPSTVLAKRRRLGIPPAPVEARRVRKVQGRPRQRNTGAPQHWEPTLVRLIGRWPDTLVAVRLGVSQERVSQVRRRMGLPMATRSGWAKQRRAA